MFGAEPAIRRLAAHDMALDRVAPSSEEEREKRLNESVRRVRVRVAALRKAMWNALAILIAAVGSAYLGQRFALFYLTGGQLGAASAFVFAWAGLSRLGWQQGSFKGSTAVERVDDLIFRFACFLGMHLAALAVM